MDVDAEVYLRAVCFYCYYCFMTRNFPSSGWQEMPGWVDLLSRKSVSQLRGDIIS